MTDKRKERDEAIIKMLLNHVMEIQQFVIDLLEEMDDAPTRPTTRR